MKKYLLLISVMILIMNPVKGQRGSFENKYYDVQANLKTSVLDTGFLMQNLAQRNLERLFFPMAKRSYPMDLHLDAWQKTYGKSVVADGVLKPAEQSIFIDMTPWNHPEQLPYEFDLRRR